MFILSRERIKFTLSMSFAYVVRTSLPSDFIRSFRAFILVTVFTIISVAFCILAWLGVGLGLAWRGDNDIFLGGIGFKFFLGFHSSIFDHIGSYLERV